MTDTKQMLKSLWFVLFRVRWDIYLNRHMNENGFLIDKVQSMYLNVKLMMTARYPYSYYDVDVLS